MNSSSKQRMQYIAGVLGGAASSEWDSNCSYLVIPNLVVTFKVICALLAVVPIVTPAYMERRLEASKHRPSLDIDPSQYLPAIKEARFTEEDRYLFRPDEHRKKLFERKTFYILTQIKYYELADLVRLGSGEPVLIDSAATLTALGHIQSGELHAELSVEQLLEGVLRQPGACVIHCTNSFPTLDKLWQQKIYSALRRIRRRPILESELGFAVIHSSVEQYCNSERRCPEKLYFEAHISQAYSVDPFLVASQGFPLVRHRDDPVKTCDNHALRLLKQHMLANKELYHPIQPPACEADKENAAVRQVTNLVPPSEPEASTSKKVCLVTDSEAVIPGRVERFHSSTYINKQLKECQTPSSFAPLHTTDFQSKSSFVGTESFSTTNRSASECAPCLDDGLAALDSLPSLLSTIAGTSADHQASVTVTHVNEEEHRATITPPVSQQSSSPLPLSPEVENKMDAHLVPPDACDQAWVDTGTQWLSKQQFVGVPVTETETESDNMKVHVTIAHIDMAPQEKTDTNTCGDPAVGVNYKTFKKVWPLQSQSDNLPAIPNQAAAPSVVQLEPYEPKLEGLDDSPEVSRNSRAHDVERDRINRLFDKMCQLPKAKMM